MISVDQLDFQVGTDNFGSHSEIFGASDMSLNFYCWNQIVEQTEPRVKKAWSSGQTREVE